MPNRPKPAQITDSISLKEPTKPQEFIRGTLSACAEWGTLCSSHLHETSFVGFFISSLYTEMKCMTLTITPLHQKKYILTYLHKQKRNIPCRFYWMNEIVLHCAFSLVSWVHNRPSTYILKYCINYRTNVSNI